MLIEVGSNGPNTIWVDYTNHHGKRAWREIILCDKPRIGKYPVAGFDKPFLEDVWILNVHMVDREGALRSLLLQNIHRFSMERPI